MEKLLVLITLSLIIYRVVRYNQTKLTRSESEDDLQELERHVHFNEKGKEQFDDYITTCTTAEMQEWLDKCESLSSDKIDEEHEESDDDLMILDY